MATNRLVQVVSVSHAKAAGNAWTVTLDTPATAGNTLVVGALGGAIIAPAGTWTRGPAYGGGDFDVSLFFATAAGGETSVSGSQGGTGENLVIYVIELPGAFTYVTGSNNGVGAIPDTSTGGLVSPSAVTVTGDSLVIGLYALEQSSTFDAQSNCFRQFGPAGQLVVSAASQDASGSAVIGAVGVADVDTTHHYPHNAATGSYAATTQYIGVGAAKAFAAQAIFTKPVAAPNVVQFDHPTDRSESEPGYPLAQWYFNADSMSGSIAGFPASPSVVQGDTIDFKVDSLGSAFTARVVELGHFGHDSLGAKLVAELTGIATTQPTPTVDTTTGATSCAAWTTSMSWAVPADQCPGLYYAIFETPTGGFATTHFVVRESSVAGRVVVVTPDQTHHAYSRWGATTDVKTALTGRSLYGAGSDGAILSFGHRAYAVSFDRPYSTPDDRGSTYIFDSEYGLLQFLRAQRYDVSVLSDMDLHADPTVLQDAAVAVMSGHHEYLTESTYDAWLNARAAGVNLLIDSSNTAGWRTRMDGTDPRLMVCYKDNGSTDDQPGFDGGTGIDPLEWTGTWRGTAAGVKTNPDVRLDNAFTGARFVASGPLPHPYVYDQSDSPMYRHSPGITGLTAGATLTDINNSAGDEVDSADGATGQPTNLVVIQGGTSFAVTTGSNEAGTVYTTAETVTPTQTLYRHDSGALVYCGGAWRAWWSATRYTGASPVTDVMTDIQNALLCLLYDLGATPAKVTALRPGEDADLTDPAVGAPTGGRNGVATAYGLTVPATGGDSSAGFFALMMP